MKINISKYDLIKILETNRAIHEEDFKNAWYGYLKFVLSELDLLRDKINATQFGQDIPISIGYSVSPPRSHLADYDRALGLLKISGEEFVELGMEDYEEFVLDNWNWKQQFIASTDAYGRSNRR